jgi:hypothetical protein
MGLSNGGGRIDLERYPNGQRAGQRAHDQGGHQAHKGVLREQQHKFGEDGRPHGGGHFAYHKTNQPQAQGLLQDHAGDGAVARANERLSQDSTYIFCVGGWISLEKHYAHK